MNWKVISLTALQAVGLGSCVQQPETFNEMVEAYTTNDVALIKPKDCINSGKTFIDARTLAEYEVSHLPKAHFINYKNPNWNILDSIDLNAEIVVYCSVGYRSEKIANKLQQKGFKNVKNMYGGIFKWANEGYPLVNSQGILTSKVHGYNAEWSKWLDQEKIEVVLN